MLIMGSFTASAQPSFEKHYGSNTTAGDGFSTEFVTCASIVPNDYTYASDAGTNQIGPDKVWIFSNDNNPCGYQQTSSNNYSLPIFSVSLVMYNDDILATPDVGDYNYNNLNPTSYPHNCEQ